MPQEKRRERETVMRRWRQQSGSRVGRSPLTSLMRGRTPQSRVHPSGASETVKTLGRGELQSAPSLLPPTPLLARYENCTLAIFILATEQQQAANKYGTHNSVYLRSQSRNLSGTICTCPGKSWEERPVTPVINKARIAGGNKGGTV